MYYRYVVNLTYDLKDHITENQPIQMLDYWNAVFRNKITDLLQDRYNKF